MLRKSTELDPGNESAWLWLANCAATPDESLDCLRKALALNPNSQIARAGLPDAMVRAAVACAADERIGDVHYLTGSPIRLKGRDG